MQSVHWMPLLVGVALVSMGASVAPPDTLPQAIPPPPPPAHPLPGDAGPCGTHAECEVIFALFQNCGPHRKVIQRMVNETETGYIAHTTSANATVAALLQTHVEHMRLRVKDGNPINTWDPFFAAIFNASARGNILMSSKNVTDGVVVTETGRSPCAVAVLREHADEVSRFVTRGMAEMAGPAHQVPSQCPWPGRHGVAHIAPHPIPSHLPPSMGAAPTKV